MSAPKLKSLKFFDMHPLYFEALQYYRMSDLKKFHLKRKSKNLSVLERKLHTVRALIVEKRHAKAREELESISIIKSDFLQAEFFALRGFLFALEASYYEAITLYHEALTLYQRVNYREGAFICLRGIANYYGNIGNYDKAEEYLFKAEEYADYFGNRLSIKTLMAYHILNKRGVQKAAIYVDDSFAEIALPSQKLLFSFNLMAFDIYFRADRIKDAKRILRANLLKKQSPDRVFFLFYQRLLNIFENKRAKKVSDSIWVDQELSLSVRVVDYLTAGLFKEAEATWLQLVNQFPLKYAANFKAFNHYDDKAIFFQLVKKLSGKESVSRNLPKIERPSVLLDYMYNALVEHPAGLRKEDFIELIWQVPYDTTYDAKFYKLVERFRKKYPELNLSSKSYIYRLCLKKTA